MTPHPFTTDLPDLAAADQHPAWCPGCGNFPILKTLNAAIDESGIDTRKVVLVSGIGQAAKTPHYPDAKVNVFNGLHGRALPAATGIKLANQELEVIVTSGDGDMYGEGGNHLLHAIRRNIGVKAFVHNNQVYGLTKGQASPTSEWGFRTPVQTHGVLSAPINALGLAILGGASLVMRSFSGNASHLKEMMLEAIAHKGGFVLLEILQPCITFNRLNTFKWYKERVEPIGEDHDATDVAAALALSRTWGEKIPIGVFYRGERKSFQEQSPILARGPLVAAVEG